MANNPNNIRLGPCRVRFLGKDIGMTQGGVDVTVKTDTKIISVDQFGQTPVDEYIIGRSVDVKCMFVETDIDSFLTWMKNAEASLVDNGTVATGTITIATVPSAADTLVINGHTFTYVASGTVPAAEQIVLGATAAATIANTIAALNASSDPNVIAGLYTVGSATTIAVSYYKSGLIGNSFTLAKTGSVITVGAGTLTGGVNATKRRVEVMSGIGTSLRATAGELLLHPQQLADNDYSEDFVVPLANTAGSVSFAYKLNAERVFTMNFTGYPDPVTTRLFLYGNKN